MNRKFQLLFSPPDDSYLIGGSGGAPPAAAPDAGTTPPAAGTPPPAAGTPPVQTPPAAGAPPPSILKPSIFGESINPDGTFKEGWSQKLQEMGLSRLANAGQRYTSEGDFLTGMENALSLIGKKVEVGPPKAGASDQQIAEFRASYGIPNDVAAYELEKVVPPGFQPGEQLSEFAKIMHENHVPKEAAQKLAAKYGEMMVAQNASATATFEAQLGKARESCEAEMRKEWGDAHDDRHQANREFISIRKDLDLNDPNVKAALSLPGIVRIVDEARRALREPGLPGAGREHGPGSASPRQQATQIMRENPKWENNPELASKVKQLYALDAQRKSSKR